MIRPIVHILYSGLGGQASVGLEIARAGHKEIPQTIAFHGVEPLHALNEEKARLGGFAFQAFRKSPGLSRASQKAMAEWITELQPQGIIVHSPAALYAANLARKQMGAAFPCRILVVEHHSNALKGLSKWLLSAACFWRADAVVYLSESYRQDVRKKLKCLFRASKTHVIANGLELAEYAMPLESTREQYLIGMQGRFVGGKDFPTLLRAIHHANSIGGPKLTLEIAGDGPRLEEFTALVSSLNMAGEVRFLGLLSPTELRKRLHHWQIYAHASDGETMSLAIMEAKAAGLPVVASDVAGVSPWIQHGTDGMLVAPKDAVAFGRALRELADQPTRAHAMGQAGLAQALAHFSIEQTWQHYARLVRGN